MLLASYGGFRLKNRSLFLDELEKFYSQELLNATSCFNRIGIYTMNNNCVYFSKVVIEYYMFNDDLIERVPVAHLNTGRKVPLLDAKSIEENIITEEICLFIYSRVSQLIKLNKKLTMKTY